jgi:hypothetical protein
MTPQASQKRNDSDETLVHRNPILYSKPLNTILPPNTNKNMGDVEVVFDIPKHGWPDDDFAKQTSTVRFNENTKSGRPNQAGGWTGNYYDEERPAPKTGSGLGPVDLDDSSLLSGYSDDFDEELEKDVTGLGVIAKKDLHMIPGSPWAKPGARHSRRPTEPLNIAKYSSQVGFLLTVLWVAYLFVVALWYVQMFEIEYHSCSRILN